MAVYIYQLPHWPKFSWNQEKLTPLLAEIRSRQGRLLGRMEALGFKLRAEANLQTRRTEIDSLTLTQEALAAGDWNALFPTHDNSLLPGST